MALIADSADTSFVVITNAIEDKTHRPIKFQRTFELAQQYQLNIIARPKRNSPGSP